MSGIILTSVVLVTAWLGWWLVWVPALVWFSVIYRGWGLVLGVILIDGYYGAFMAVPWQSIVALIVVCIVQVVRPYLYTTV
jgi:hypothetical protein